MRKTKNKHGELIPLNIDAQYVFIKGHVNESEAQEQLDMNFSSKFQLKSIEHDYARWGIGYDECGERQTWLYSGRNSGEKGSFPVTIVNY